MLDIIIPHYNEPWSVGQKMFDMLSLQRDVDFSKIHVILVNDGPEHSLPDEYFTDRPYIVEQISIPHSGVSAARNAGLKAASHEWVMFCDFDDMFAHVYALRDILSQLPAEGFDGLWADLLAEDIRDGRTYIYKRDEMNLVFLHSKLYRRQFLLDHNLWFDTNISFDEDGEFNAIFYAIVDLHRTGKIKTSMPPYIWCWRKDSTVHQLGRDDEGAFDHWNRNKTVCDVFMNLENLPRKRYYGMVARTVWDAYYELNRPNLSDRMKALRSEFIEWFLDHKSAFMKVDENDVPKIKEIARQERKHSDHREEVSIEQWLYELNDDNQNGGIKL